MEGQAQHASVSFKRPVMTESVIPRAESVAGDAGHAASGRNDGGGMNVTEDFDAPMAMHDDAGVDLTQIDMMLAMTPRERLQFLYVTALSLGRLMPDADTD